MRGSCSQPGRLVAPLMNAAAPSTESALTKHQGTVLMYLIRMSKCSAVARKFVWTALHNCASPSQSATAKSRARVRNHAISSSMRTAASFKRRLFLTMSFLTRNPYYENKNQTKSSRVCQVKSSQITNKPSQIKSSHAKSAATTRSLGNRCASCSWSHGAVARTQDDCIPSPIYEAFPTS